MLVELDKFGAVRSEVALGIWKVCINAVMHFLKKNTDVFECVVGVLGAIVARLIVMVWRKLCP